ncbi:MAG: hydroxyquinol 1,2-dioxygenase [Acidimicrobiia bacterium]
MYETKIASLASYSKGGIEIVDDDPKHYAFSNVFEVANTSQPYEKVVVGMNRQYTLEAIRTEGTSEWRTAPHDEFALVMDGEVLVRLMKLKNPRGFHGLDDQGSVRVEGDPDGTPMGVIKAKRGHMALLPADSAYQFHADTPGVILLQTMKGPDSLERWADICITTV